MKKPLTNKIYGVTLKRCACIYVEAESPREAMNIANKYTNDIDEEEFEYSDVEVDCCDSYSGIADGKYTDTIYTQDEIIDVDEYIDRYEAQENNLEAWQRGGWDMTNQLELPFEGCV